MASTTGPLRRRRPAVAPASPASAACCAAARLALAAALAVPCAAGALAPVAACACGAIAARGSSGALAAGGSDTLAARRSGGSGRCCALATFVAAALPTLVAPGRTQVHRHDGGVIQLSRERGVGAFEHSEVLDVLPAEDDEVVDFAGRWNLRHLTPLRATAVHGLQRDGRLRSVDCVQDALVANVRVGHEADLASYVRDGC
mmetsp:Transcript_128314/g.273599  ORF Transcript_128314/g.273599 Transcript_128314/m.273599 type:complete len:202 (-) Transcript_128314:78-683(-)